MEEIKAMHTLICALNDERAYSEWIYTVPDEPTDDDFEWIASDPENLLEVTDLFISLMKRYAKYGFVIGNHLVEGGAAQW